MNNNSEMWATVKFDLKAPSLWIYFECDLKHDECYRIFVSFANRMNKRSIHCDIQYNESTA